jgi:tetratricopeptide (TPR) repeat protein
MDPLTLAAVLLSFASKVSGGQLLRFARSVLGERFAATLEKELSPTRQAARLGEELIATGRLSDEVFDQIAEIVPEAKDLVERARQEWLREQDPRPQAAPGKSDDKDDFLKRLEARLDAEILLPTEPPRTLLEPLALLPAFDPIALTRSALVKELVPPVEGDLLVLLGTMTEPRPDGRWVFRMAARRRILGPIADEGRLGEAVRRAGELCNSEEDKLYLRILSDCARFGHANVGAGDPDGLLIAARTIGDWFAASRIHPIDADHVSALIEGRQKVAPLRKLVGTHFRGREIELALLRDQRGFGPEHKRVFALTGLGGVGKSALLGQLILERIDRNSPPPVVYIDFDRSEANPANPRGLIELIARNLGLLYAGSDQARGALALESASAGDIPSVSLNLPVAPGATQAELLAALNSFVRDLPASEPPLFVFDTFEQVMVRGPAVVGAFASFLDALLEALPNARIILSGRGDIAVPIDLHQLRLTELDEEASDAVLEARGLSDPEVRRSIFDTVGGSPLMLRLVSRAIKSGELDPAKLNMLKAKAHGLRLHGLLYSRVLGHIGDEEVQRLAHPGLIVRRVTPDVIREVLARVCKIEDSRVDALFERLPNYVDLFEPEEAPSGESPSGALRHRQDLREEVIELMVSDPKWKDHIRRIHQRAVRFYSGLPGSLARAEQIYHQLMLDADPELLDALWSTELGESLTRTWSDPFPQRARAWLGLRLGLVLGDGTSDFRLIDWEVRAARIARSHLDARNLLLALDSVRERAERTPTSPVPPVEIEALREIGDLDEALQVAMAAIARAPRSDFPQHRLSMQLAAAGVAFEAGDLKASAKLADEAAELAKALHDAPSRLKALELLARIRPQEQTSRALERAFVNAPAESLQQNEATVAQVINTIGLDSPAVLGKAATSFAHVERSRLVRTDPLIWKDLFEEVKALEGGGDILQSLAMRVGLARGDADTLGLATNTLRYGLQGEALSQVLESFGSDKGVLARSLATFDMSLK